MSLVANRAWLECHTTVRCAFAEGLFGVRSLSTTVNNIINGTKKQPAPSALRCLVLNVTMEPLSIITVSRGLMLLQKNRAEVVEKADFKLRSERAEWEVPSVLILRRFVNTPRARKTKAEQVSNKAVLLRDDFMCAYCGLEARTVDHIVPRSRGGTNTWDNVVACCEKCNSRKGNRLLGEGGNTMRMSPRHKANLQRIPIAPTLRYNTFPTSRVPCSDPRWAKFFEAQSTH